MSRSTGSKSGHWSLRQNGGPGGPGMGGSCLLLWVGRQVMWMCAAAIRVNPAHVPPV